MSCGILWIIWLVPALRLVRRVRQDCAVADDVAVRADRSGTPHAGRPWQYRLRTLFLAPLVLWLIVSVLFPKVITGDFCCVRIDELFVDDNGKVVLNCSTRCSSGTSTIHEDEPRGGGGGGYAGGGIPAWPYPGHFGLTFTWGSGHDSKSAKEIRDHLLIEQGKTYRVVPGKPLYFYKFKTDDGKEYSSCVRITPGDYLKD